MRIIFLTSGSPHHFYLINEIHKEFPITKVFFQTRHLEHRSFTNRIKRLLSKKGLKTLPSNILKEIILGRLRRKQYDYEVRAFFQGQKPFLKPEIPFEHVRSFNSESGIERIRKSEPDLAVVFGTDILKESVIRIPKLGIVNIHRAILPEYRGGGTDWWICYNKDFEYLGCSIHHLVPDLDAGGIIVKRRYELSPDDGIYTLRYKTTLISVELLKETIRQFEAGCVNSEPQVGGTLWRSKDLTVFKMLKAYKSFKRKIGMLR